MDTVDSVNSLMKQYLDYHQWQSSLEPVDDTFGHLATQAVHRFDKIEPPISPLMLYWQD